jgi:DNA-binding NtrC family response regulator
MTSYASLRSAVDSMRMGAMDYIAKPFDHEEMITAVTRIIGKSANARARTAANKSANVAGIIGNSAAMREVFTRLEKVAPTSATVLIHGETGTGKELVARAIHDLSPRSGKPLISVNCAAIPDTLIESELFGYEKGAFTGAASTRDGLVAAADGGTLFLDEIGELPLEAQARLLRVIQEGEVRPIGSVVSRKVDVRLVAATHRNLRQLSQEGKFREDLYYRLNVLQLTLPPLRDRGKDILILADMYIERFCRELNQTVKQLSPEAVQAVTTYTWPGNVRELENAMQRAVILSDTAASIDHTVLGIDLELVATEVIQRDGESPYAQNLASVDTNRSKPVSQEPTEDLSLEDYFQHFVLEHQESMSETELARKLGISRKCLWERRQKLGIERKKTLSAAK